MIYVYDRHYKDEMLLNSVLRRIYGINEVGVKKIMSKHGYSTKIRLKEVGEYGIRRMMKHLEDRYVIGRELKRIEDHRVMEEVRSGSYKGIRRGRGLPIRGQRTHTNARTARRMKIQKVEKNRK